MSPPSVPRGAAPLLASRELAFFTFLFPLLIFVLLGSVYGDDPVEGDGVTARVPARGVLGYGVAATAFAGLAILVVIRRESGNPEAAAGTPLPAWAYVWRRSDRRWSCSCSRRSH